MGKLKGINSLQDKAEFPHFLEFPLEKELRELRELKECKELDEFPKFPHFLEFLRNSLA